MAQIKRKHVSRKHIRRLIVAEVSFFNGWSVSEENMQGACQKAADKILRYLGRKEPKQ